MNKEVLIDPRTGKAKKCWSLDVPGLLASGWEKPGEKEPEAGPKQITTTTFEPIEDEPIEDEPKPKPRRTRKPK